MAPGTTERFPDVHDEADESRAAGTGGLPSINGQLISPRRLKAMR